MSKQIKVALIGNPNTGKTSTFNQLTGLNQKVGNYPGITVSKKEGVCKLPRGIKAYILDLPGTYSLNTNSLDENIVIELLLNKNDRDYPDVVVVTADVENLKRNLLLFTQIKDLGVPVILAVNMADQMKRKGISLDIELLEKQLKTKVALISARKGTGIDELKERIVNYKNLSVEPCIDTTLVDKNYFENLKKTFPNQDIYKLWLVITQDVNYAELNRKSIKDSSAFSTKSNTDLKRLQQKETALRYQFINKMLEKAYTVDRNKARDLRSILDRVLTHKIYGYLIFFVVLFGIFQATYDWSNYPMDFIDGIFVSLSDIVKTSFSPGAFTDLISEGIIPGLGGIVIFIPQIAFLFLFISVLEETGYMSRVVFLMDNIMRRFGLSGKSVVPLVSGIACAIPAIMASRNIEDWKERLLTILVTPFINCSARLPVYLIIIALVIPDDRFLGMSVRGLTLMLLYLSGFVMAVLAAYIINRALKIKTKSFFVVEMPEYKLPLLRNVAYTVVEKTKTFIFGAGKIILALTIILWFLASNGPSERFNNAEAIVVAMPENETLTQKELDQEIATFKLKNSYIGIMGSAIEPALRPLGYDWKISIAIVSSFAAREVFVSTLATIYSVGSDEEETIKNRMAAEINPRTGKKLFNFASGISLMLFYAFAMQCMSTLAIVKRETNSWKWPLIQLVIMTGFAYIVALTAYQFLK